MTQDYSRVPLGYEDLFRRKQEQWAHHHHHHSTSRPSQSSHIFTMDFGSEVEKPLECVADFIEMMMTSLLIFSRQVSETE